MPDAIATDASNQPPAGPPGGAMPGSLLSSAQLDGPAILAIIELAARLRDTWPTPPRTLEHKAVALVFEKPSLRTRTSFDVGLTRLGAHVTYLDQSTSPLGDRESIKDFARTLERYADAIVARVRRHGALQELDRFARVPIVNALSDYEHPCQALGDALTIRTAFGRLAGVRVAYIGDGNNVCNSLVLTMAALGAHVTVVAPSAYEPEPGVLVSARQRAEAAGGSVTLATDPDAIAGHDVVYTDTWVSMGSESERDERVEAFQRYRVTAESMNRASVGGKCPSFMHCLPAFRGVEVDDEVIDGPGSLVYDQAENRMHAQNALLTLLLGDESNTTNGANP
ncbi:MAG: ornithine carbamoyltransferase [Phycisphaerales bacterium JB060]